MAAVAYGFKIKNRPGMIELANDDKFIFKLDVVGTHNHEQMYESYWLYETEEAAKEKEHLARVIGFIVTESVKEFFTSPSLAHTQEF